ncbi:hypothetical protein P9Z71_06280 [Glaesserella parasuis]|uniref:hypothetical protein n=1 Tax=Glaesserella parasuis TaxID=738 RepID=UPI002436E79B|nr:hypothetical protein [Glaesserella parasuis]MDG6309829.1 hypothetical protein [Glaesserella parasuis]
MKTAIFEIFRSGKHNGMGADAKRTWNDEELAITAQLYNENVRSAPLVIGHPHNNEPTFGTVKRLIHCKNALFAEAMVSPDLVNRIKQGDFSGISASFITPNQPSNPANGLAYYLNHVGFLEEGKQSPAVKGMLPPEISVENLYFNEEKTPINLFYAEDSQYLNTAERLHQKTLYFQNALDISYSKALEITLTQG